MSKKKPDVEETVVTCFEDKKLPEEQYGPRTVSSHITKKFSGDLTDKEAKDTLEILDKIVHADVARKEARARKEVREAGKTFGSPWGY